jgi:hypothetical protein
MGGALRICSLMNKIPELFISLQNLVPARGLSSIKKDHRTTPFVCIDIHKNRQIPLVRRGQNTCVILQSDNATGELT